MKTCDICKSTATGQIILTELGTDQSTADLCKECAYKISVLLNKDINAGNLNND